MINSLNNLFVHIKSKNLLQIFNLSLNTYGLLNNRYPMHFLHWSKPRKFHYISGIGVKISLNFALRNSESISWQFSFQLNRIFDFQTPLINVTNICVVNLKHSNNSTISHKMCATKTPSPAPLGHKKKTKQTKTIEGRIEKNKKNSSAIFLLLWKYYFHSNVLFSVKFLFHSLISIEDYCWKIC